MTTQRADARKRQEAMWGEPRWSPGDGETREARALAALQRVYPTAERQEASALLDALADEGLIGS